MPVRDALPAVLRGELGADLKPETRASLEHLAHDAQSEKKLASVRDELGSRLKQPDPSWGVSYLLAAICALNGEVERAQQTLLALGDKVAAKKQWEPLAAIAERSLALVHSQAAAALLVKAHEGIGKDPERIDALSRAWAIVPDDLELALLLAKRLGDAGQLEDRRALLAELAPKFAAEDRYQAIEDAALEFVEHSDYEGLAIVAQTLPIMAQQDATKEAASLADVLLQGLAKGDRAGEALEPLRKLVIILSLAKGDEAVDPFRGAMALALKQGPGRTIPTVDQALAQADIEGDTPLPKAIEAFDAIAALAPGRGVLHDGFGPGRVLSNDTETVVIDFMKSKAHKMPYVAARRTLTAVAEDDLRLMRFTQPEAIKRMRDEDHASMVVGALKVLGGAADAPRLKMFLVGSDLVPAKDWTTFWRKAKSAAEKDIRIDHARAFEQHYKLAPVTAKQQAAADLPPLPPLQPRKPDKTNLATIKKFLAQHPNLQGALKGRFGRFVQKVTLDTDADRVDRARGGLYFTNWYPERRLEWLDVLRSLWEQGLAISDMATEDEQLALLDDSRHAGVEAEAILSALDSRFAAVREEAEKDRAQLDDAGKAKLRRTLLDHSSQYPAAVMRLIEEAFDAKEAPEDSWRLFFASLQLIEERPKPSIGEKILRWLEDNGDFERLLTNSEATTEMRLKVRVLLRQWRSSDRYLFPALDAIARCGLGEEKQWVLENRQKKTDKLFSQVGEQADDFDVPIMTRATYARMQHEVETLERELRTTIPQTIQRARELGDLKENAEYHSAKQKQANVQKQVASLTLRLTRARFVEDADFREGVAGLGTEVVLDAQGERLSYWILGDGEQHLGENVISFQAPIGKSLVGRTVGDEVEIGEGVARRRYRVESIARRLPPADAATPSAS